MNITNDDISFWGSALVIMGVVFSCIKGFVIMKEKVRVLDNKFDSGRNELNKKIEDLEVSHDKDITEIKTAFTDFKRELDKLRESGQQAQRELIDLINKNHISMLEKISESKK